MLDLQTEVEGDVIVLMPTGRIDGATAKAYEEDLIARIEKGQTRILMSCESVEYISSAGLRVLLMASRRAEKLVLCSVRETVNDVFKFSGFAEIIPIHGDRETALASF